MTTQSDPSITLYSYITSPFAWKVHCYLLYKKLPFKNFYVNPANSAKELPMGTQIPVLKIGGEARNNSSALGIWLDDVYPETASLIPDDILLKNEVLKIDQFVSDILIPTVFYTVYPQLSGLHVTNISNAFRLGFCVDRTTTNGLPFGLRFLWPFFIRYTPFIRRIVATIAKTGDVSACRKSALSFLETKLKDRQFLAGTEQPSLADLSAWPQIMIPSKLGLSGFDDYLEYPNIKAWVIRIEAYIELYPCAPAIVPDLEFSTKLQTNSCKPHMTN